MKWMNFLTAMLAAFSVIGQTYGPAKGFPADPVISATVFEDKLYLGTQGSGVYEFSGERIVPSAQFSSISTASIFGFGVVNGELVPQREGKLQPYPIQAADQRGTRYTIYDGRLEVAYSDEARELFRGPSGLWSFSSLPFQSMENGVVFVRTRSKLTTYTSDGTLLDESSFQGLIFDLAHLPEGLVLSTESGYYRWEGHWHKFGAGLPVFAFDGLMARTPLGALPTAKLLKGSWSIDDITELEIAREQHENFYDVDTIGERQYAFCAEGLLVREEGETLFQVDVLRGLPAMRPGNFDAAHIGDELWVATPQGLYALADFGAPNTLEKVQWSLAMDGLNVEVYPKDMVEPNSISFSAAIDYQGASPLYARYRINEGAWQSWSLENGVLLDHPATGSYVVDVQVSAYMNFEVAQSVSYTFGILAKWYKRPWIWALVVALLAAVIIFWQRRERLKTAERLELQERLAEAELASKRNQMNPHFLFNALDAISNFIFKNQPKDAVGYMGKLAKLMRLTLDSTRSNTMVLADELELLKQYLALCELRYGSFEYTFNVDESIDEYDLKVPPMLLQPILENAVQHALRPRMKEGVTGKLRVDIEAIAGGVTVEISDNGPGFDVDKSTSKSHGLSILKERLELLTKKYGQRFEMEVKQSGIDPLHSGTTISLILSTDVLD